MQNLNERETIHDIAFSKISIHVEMMLSSGFWNKVS